MELSTESTRWQQKTNDRMVVSIQFSSEVVAVVVLLDVKDERIRLANIA